MLLNYKNENEKTVLEKYLDANNIKYKDKKKQLEITDVKKLNNLDYSLTKKFTFTKTDIIAKPPGMDNSRIEAKLIINGNNFSDLPIILE